MKGIKIYAGKGVSDLSLKHTLAFLIQYAEGLPVETISTDSILHADWEHNTALIVVPGGADLPYKRMLDGKGNAKIKAFVEQGGAYLGICAGAYFGGSKVEFALGEPLEVKGERELGFFPGVVRGPHLAPFDYESQSGARAARLFVSGERDEPVVYFNGGGYFDDADAYSDVEVLAWYDAEHKYAAIVRRKIGKGVAVLSGVHFEYDPELLDPTDPYLAEILFQLREGDAARRRFSQRLLNMCM
jgi:biotin--protein ligase